MSDQLPDRLSVDPKSPYYNADVLSRDVGIRFKGVEKTNVEEYCVSEGWVRVTAGNAKDRYGNPLTIKVHGPVEPYFRDKSVSHGAHHRRPRDHQADLLADPQRLYRLHQDDDELRHRLAAGAGEQQAEPGDLVVAEPGRDRPESMSSVGLPRFSCRGQHVEDRC